MQDHEDLSGVPTGLYLRISDDREGRALGVERQQTAGTACIAAIKAQLVDVYVDNDISASMVAKKERPEYQRMVKDAKAGRIRLIVAYNQSRLTRDSRVTEDLFDLRRQYDTAFRYVAGPAPDFKQAAGRTMARFQSVVDTGYAETISELAQGKKLQDAERGRLNGGPRLYGYGLIVGHNPLTDRPIRDAYQQIPEEVSVLREMRDRLFAGDSVRAIRIYLNDRGIPTAKGARWTIGGIKRTLLSPSYVIFDPDDPEERGTRMHHDVAHRCDRRGVFSQSDHALLEKVLGGKPEYSVLARRYLLSGVIHCECGAPMHGNGKTENGRYIRRYVCKREDRTGLVVGCGKVFRVAEPLEYLISESVLYRFETPDVEEALAPAEDKLQVQTLTQEIVELQRRRTQLAREHAITPYDDYPVMLAAIKERTDAAQTKLLGLRRAEAKTALLPPPERLRDVFSHASIEWRLSVIRLLVGRVTVRRSTKPGTRWHGWQFNPDDVVIDWIA